MGKHFPGNLEQKLVENEQSYRRLKFGDFKGSTKNSMLIAQDQAISKTYSKIKC